MVEVNFVNVNIPYYILYMYSLWVEQTNTYISNESKHWAWQKIYFSKVFLMCGNNYLFYNSNVSKRGSELENLNFNTECCSMVRNTYV